MDNTRQSGGQEIVLAALANLEGFATRKVRGRATVSIADLRDRLLQMSVNDLDRALLALEAQGRVRLERFGAGGGTVRERAAAVVGPRGELHGYASIDRRVRKASKRPREEELRTLNVVVPAPLLEALDRYVSIKANDARPNAPSRADVARDLLERILDRRADDRRLGQLRAAILSAIAEEAHRTGVATLWDVRRRLAAIPQAELDRALLALEANGALVLAPRPEHGSASERDVRAAVWCERRGALSRVKLPVPKSRLGRRRRKHTG